MAKLFNRVKVNTATVGTGTMTLGAASANNFCTFAEGGVTDGQVVAYVIEDGTDFECGIGTYTASGTTLSRTTVRLSKIGGTAGTTKISLSGAAIVFLSPHQEDLQSKSETQTAATFWGGPSSGAAAAPTFRALLGSDMPMTRRTITGADTMIGTDSGNIVEVTSGTFTLAFTAAATLANGWKSIIYNRGTGDVTLDPNSTEQIDTLTTWVLYPGGAILVQCDGSNFHSVLLAPMRKQFDASGTFTKPGVGSFIRIQAWGAGGSGSRGRAAATAGGGGGGGGGGFAEAVLPFSSFGATETITIGAGGVAQTVDSTAGNVGGNTTVGSILTAFGGGGGGPSANGVPGTGGGGGGGLSAGANGAGSNIGGSGGAPNPNSWGLSNAAVDDNVYGGAAGGSGGLGGTSTFGGGGGGNGGSGANAALAGGKSYFGGGGGGGSSATGTNGIGGTSTFGGAGGAGTSGAVVGVTGTQPGGGGGGSQNANSGAGGAGRVVLYIW